MHHLSSRVLSCFSAVLSGGSVTIYAPSFVQVAGFFFVCLFSALLSITLRDGNLWLGNENLAGGEAKEICLCYSLLPFVHRVGLGELCPAPFSAV